MLRRNTLLRTLQSWCSKVPPNARVGVFPLHLDPPTVQHRELFRLLIGDTIESCSVPNSGNDNLGSGRADTLWYFQQLAEDLDKSKYVPFEHLILVPNVRFPADLRLSAHIAALATLVTRGLARVHIDFTALERPADDMLRVYELTQKYKNSILVHWLQDAQEMRKWAHFEDIKRCVPLVLLQTVYIGVSEACKSLNAGLPKKTNYSHRRVSVNHMRDPLAPRKLFSGKAPDSEVPGPTRDSHKVCSHWLSECGGEKVQISPSYQYHPRTSWLASPNDALAPLEPTVGGVVLQEHISDHGASKLEERNVEDGKQGCGFSEGSAVGEASIWQAPCSSDSLSGQVPTTVPSGRKICELVEELYQTPPPIAEGEKGDLSGRLKLSHVEVYNVSRCTGADVRHALWEGELDSGALLTDPVKHYIVSHGLYRDYRKSVFPKMCNAAPGMTVSASGGVACARSYEVRGWKAPHAGFTSLSFPGLVPRLELHPDKGNSFAHELYEKLSVFSPAEGEEPDLIVPIGGDGYMMHCIRNNWQRFIPFFGVNAGHAGHLLNDPSTLDELFSAPLKLYTTSMLYCLAEQEESPGGDKTVHAKLAFNDAWVERSSGQTALIRVLVNGQESIRRLCGDGVLVATAAGSTAYCRALGASPLPVNAPLIQLVGNNVLSPPQWRPTLLNQEDQVEFEVIDSDKRPCRCFVDSVDVGNVTRMVVRSSRAAGVAIAFAFSCDLQQKLYQMQFPKVV
ncbi:putative ATP NAD kinase [Trypanosoma vivax]|nr:ATP-NAD kinase-like protein [Trypanosoma vivax]KAH8613007.1 putative ATP NAD kinase [Trypanosoma vivax]